MNRQVLLDVMREMKGIQKHGETLQFVRFDKRPDLSRVKTAITPIRRAISSTVRVEGFLTGTGEKIVRHVQVASNSILTRDQIEAIAVDFLVDKETEYGITLSRVLLVEQVKRA